MHLKYIYLQLEIFVALKTKHELCAHTHTHTSPNTLYMMSYKKCSCELKTFAHNFSKRGALRFLRRIGVCIYIYIYVQSAVCIAFETSEQAI